MFSARQRFFGLFPACVGLALAVSSCASSPQDAESDVTSSTAQAVTGAVGDWTGFTSGECVHGVYQFYLHRYGISLTGTCAHATVGNCESCGACMAWEGPNVEPPASLFNKYAWGTTTPQTYDIVVYPPRTAAVGPGHIACVDHMTSTDNSAWQDLYVMDTNYYGGDTMATAVHTVSRAPYGIFRLKSLDNASAANAAPKGFLDGANCTGVSGWAQDPSAPTDAIFADVYFNAAAGQTGAVGQRLTANIARPDLCGPLGSCDHGYSTTTPRGAMDGSAHPVFVYGIDSAGGTNTLLTNAPGSFTCAAPPIPSGTVKRLVTTPAILSDWQFSMFFDAAPYTSAQLAAVPDGAQVPAAPSIVQVTGQPEIYVVDGSSRRLVADMTSFAAWRFTGDMIKPIAVSDLAALAVGSAWPASPLLANTPGGSPNVYVLDNAELADDGGASVGIAPSGTSSSGGDANGDASGGSSGGCSVMHAPDTSDGPVWMLLPLLGMLVRRRRS